MTINTKRLTLRPWTEEDLEPFAQLNADARAREYFPGLLSRQESDASVKLASEHIKNVFGIFGRFPYWKLENSSVL